MFKSIHKMLPRLKEIFLGLCLWCWGHTVWAQTDTSIQLKEVPIIAVPEQKPIPVQVIRAAMLEKVQAIQLSDAIKYFSGVTVKDYGGIGGLKTVSVRGLGSNHTGVMYDGIITSDSQTGQVDIARFSLDNIESVSLSNGSPEDIFQPARAFSSASILSIKTDQPVFKDKKYIKGHASFRTGSFGLVNPSFFIQNKVGHMMTTSITGEWQQASGKYLYVLDYGGITSHQRRKNTDVESLRGEANIYINLSTDSRLSLKTYYYQSDRGLPGATIYYNPYSSQRLWDQNTFVQAKLETRISQRFSTLIHTKYGSTYLHYLDPDYLGSSGKIENIYKQKEFYFSASGLFTISSAIQLSAASDLIYNTMDANLYQFAYPTRYSWLSALTGKLEKGKFTFLTTLLATLLKEQVRMGDQPKASQKLSPAIILGYRANGGKLLLRAFYKDIFRLPTFNDLYYTGIGNAQLKPEYSYQLNLGATYFLPWSTTTNSMYVTVDLYHNQVKNKIVALPTKNLFIWSMMNLGEARGVGGDFSFKSEIKIPSHARLTLHTSYSFQKIVDRTNPYSKTYGDQIAYTPVHSGSGIISLENKWANLSYTILFSGSRYTLNHNTALNQLKGYTEQGISASKKISFHKVDTNLKVDLLNIMNTQYEIVRNFPMPGRSIRLTLSARL